MLGPQNTSLPNLLPGVEEEQVKHKLVCCCELLCQDITAQGNTRRELPDPR